MEIIEAPHTYPDKPDLFFGGGISNCPMWQDDLAELLKNTPGIALNPRRSTPFVDEIAGEQIEWEHKALRDVETVLFWFPQETLCPITLFELGVFSQKKDVNLIVGTHPNYARRFDVVKQLELERPEVTVYETLEELANTYSQLYKKLN